MNSIQAAIQVAFAREHAGDDRAAVFPTSNGHLLVLADGAGGTSGGAAAAEVVVDGARTASLRRPQDCLRFLEDLDQQLMNIGQTTAVVVVVSHDHVFGASVGDSGAWLINDQDAIDLTEHQNRKPLLGSGDAMPVAFGPFACIGRVLAGSDGLFNYIAHDRIRKLARQMPLAQIPAALIDAARLKSGALQDDIAVIVAGS